MLSKENPGSACHPGGQRYIHPFSFSFQADSQDAFTCKVYRSRMRLGDGAEWGGGMKKLNGVWFLVVACLSLILSPALTAQDADKQKLIEIEKALANNPASGPPATATAKQYLYDGPLNHLTNFGRFGSMTKAKVLAGY